MCASPLDRGFDSVLHNVKLASWKHTAFGGVYVERED